MKGTWVLGGTAAALGKRGREGGREERECLEGCPGPEPQTGGVAWGGELGARLPELGPPGKRGRAGDNVGPVIGAGPGVCSERQPVGLNLQ